MERSAEMERAVEACQSCHEICTESIPHCLRLGGRHADPHHVTHLLDCADICLATARCLMRSSTLFRQFCTACAEVCDACAKSCEALAEEHHMRLCGDQCRRTAELCQELAKVPIAFI